MSKYVMALDQGTTSSSRAIIFDRAQNIVDMAQKEFTQHLSRGEGWVEHDPMEIYASPVRRCMMEVLARSGMDVRAKSRPSASPTSARPTVVWDRATGTPDLQCNRLAVPPHSRILRGPEAAGARRPMLHGKTGLIRRRRIFARPRSNGFWTTCPGARRAGRAGRTVCSAPWTAG